MTRSGVRSVGVVLTLVGLMSVGCGSANVGPAVESPIAAEPVAATDARVWVLDGRVAAVRRSPAPADMYGAHGVDYAPDTAPGATVDC
jgi:hypothetical protein